MRSRASRRSRGKVRGGDDVVTGLDLNGAVGGDPDELADRPAGPVFCPAVDSQCGAEQSLVAAPPKRSMPPIWRTSRDWLRRVFDQDI
jgi:hypothetical protein